MADVIRLAEAVAAAVGPDAEMSLVPEFALKDLKPMRVVVVPCGMKHRTLARSVREDDIKVQVGVMKRCTEDELVDLVNTVTGIGLSLLHIELEGTKCLNVEYEPLYSPEEFREKRQFMGVLTLTFREVSRHGVPHRV